MRGLRVVRVKGVVGQRGMGVGRGSRGGRGVRGLWCMGVGWGKRYGVERSRDGQSQGQTQGVVWVDGNIVHWL